MGYLFYGYGIYAIERVYNSLYLNYLAIFGLATWLLVLGAIDVVRRTAGSATLPRPFRRISAAGALLQPLIFYPLWIGMLIPVMVNREQIDSLYSIFILDLVFIMPAFLLVGGRTIPRPQLGRGADTGDVRPRSRPDLLSRTGGACEAGLRLAAHRRGATAADAAHRAFPGLSSPSPQAALLQAQHIAHRNPDFYRSCR